MQVSGSSLVTWVMVRGPLLVSGAPAAAGYSSPPGCRLGPETSRGFYVYSSCLCLLVTALSLTTTAGSDKLKEFARVGLFSTAITKFN